MRIPKLKRFSPVLALALLVAPGAVLGLLAGCGGSQGGGTSSVFVSGNEDELYAEGLRQRRAGDLAGAEQSFVGATRANSRYVAAWLALGSLYLQQERHAEARDSFARAVEIQVRNVDAQLGLAQSEAALENVDAANAAASQAVELAQRQNLSDVEGEALRISAQMQLLTGDVEGAIGSLERTLQLDATNIQARVQLAGLYDAEGRRNDAVRLLTLAAGTMRDPAGLLHIGRTFYEFGMTDRAAEVLQRGYEAAPDDNQIGYYLAASNLDLGNRDVAISIASRIISRSPEFLDAYIIRGQGEMRRVSGERATSDAAARREALGRARPDANYVLERDPNHYGALVLLGQIENGLGNTDEALAAWSRAAQADPTRRSALMEASAVELARENHAGVVAVLEPNIDNFPRNIEMRERLGRSMVAAGRGGDGAALLSPIAEQKRTDHDLHHVVARAALDNPGSIPASQALVHAQEAITHGGSDRIAYRVALIDALHANDRTSEARRYATDSLRDFPENPQLLDRIQDMR